MRPKHQDIFKKKEKEKKESCLLDLLSLAKKSDPRNRRKPNSHAGLVPDKLVDSARLTARSSSLD
jgi:hypothetical protein